MLPYEYDQRPVAYEPTAIYQPAPIEATGLAELVYVTGANGQLVAVRRDSLPQAAPLYPMPVPERGPAIDRRAQQMAGAGILALGVGIGGSMLFSAIAAATTAIGLLAACLALGLLLRGGSGGGGKVNVNVRVENNTSVRGRGWRK